MALADNVHVQRSFGPHDTGTLYLVPTPIGNLGDFSPRAVDVMRSVDVIAAEDTRNTQKLLTHYDITTHQISFHEHNTQERIPQLLARLQAGESIAQVSDAGMPAISDPGQELVAACVAANIPVVALPGPNAGLTALIASGLVTQPFAFIGFLPRKAQEQKTFLQQFAELPMTTIYYESPMRIAKTLARFTEVVGGDRQIVVARELTKKFESYIRGTVAEVADYVAANAPKGEMVILLAPPAPAAPVTWSAAAVQDAVADRVAHGEKPTKAAKAVAQESGWHRQDVYQEYLTTQDRKQE
ncbi:RsmI [Schleiferilactobacillus shenzhenensis LY-73]|uniref:Ribosomal RNA small subunit methyltransferase I n=1 Tax=Schleiferilactobacillus shenzhenensis LY-73 TaxID=1231336 RepID=U4TWW7_9LACO|nr:RsmI [Schleiferilactobacillus shenzhenensis LY-73]